jgi:hypothetical protein
MGYTPRMFRNFFNYSKIHKSKKKNLDFVLAVEENELFPNQTQNVGKQGNKCGWCAEIS